MGGEADAMSNLVRGGYLRAEQGIDDPVHGTSARPKLPTRVRAYRSFFGAGWDAPWNRRAAAEDNRTPDREGEKADLPDFQGRPQQTAAGPRRYVGLRGTTSPDS
jgi:hypothetical protein